ncbi:MAG: hypothetical protein C0406_08145 [Sideroxydans sp.]|nr:hypothetical protein [Sideroxydans sp.]
MGDDSKYSSGSLIMNTETKNTAVTAESIISKMYPDSEERYLVLKQLLASISYAEKTAPGAWSVSLQKKKFCLSVGSTEVLIGVPEIIGLNLVSIPSKLAPSESFALFVTNYAACPGATRYNGEIEHFKGAISELQSSHFDFIDECAFTSSGKPYKSCKYQNSHNQGLVEYAQKVVASHK